MLIKILKRLAQGGIYSNKKIALELGIDDALVEQMIEKLIQMGYIEKENINNCGDGCGSCSSKSCCSSNSSNVDINIWKITEKGNKAINSTT